MCDSANKDGIVCETDKTKLDNFLSNMQINLQAYYYDVDFNSNDPVKVKKNKGTELKLLPKQ